MRRLVMCVAALGAIGGLARLGLAAWRRNPRIGTRFVNSVVNPRLLDRGLAGGAASELGTLEHVGRRSGARRMTPVHPEPIPDGFRIVVPLGDQSQWARNVLAAGHCRLQLHDHVYELDEPKLIPASEADDLPGPVRSVMSALGFRYLTLRTLNAMPAHLESPQLVLA
jgi:deazaflavin-dependent oxidoreductase (nitroreductase family)